MTIKYEIHDAHDLQHRVHFALAQMPYVACEQISYQIVDKEVVLPGPVRTYYQKQMAQESLRKINGIRRVRNELSVVRR